MSYVGVVYLRGRLPGDSEHSNFVEMPGYSVAVQQNPHRRENDLANTTHRAYTIVYSASPHPDGHLGFFLPFISVSTSLSNRELSCFTLTVMSIHSRFLGWNWLPPRVHAMVGWFCHLSYSYKNSLSIPASQGSWVVQILILPSCLKHGASVSAPWILLYIRVEAYVRRLEGNFQESLLSTFFSSGPVAWTPVSAS